MTKELLTLTAHLTKSIVIVCETERGGISITHKSDGRVLSVVSLTESEKKALKAVI